MPFKLNPPQFSSREKLRASFGNIEFWRPFLRAILKRHNLRDTGTDVVAGYNPTFPTFICGDVVIKLFGYSPPQWMASHEHECNAHQLLSTDPRIAAPQLLGQGHLFANAETPWPYLITRRIKGDAVRRVRFSVAQKQAIAKELGRQVNRVHALPVVGITSDADWPALDVEEANRQSSLPPHLVAQIHNYLKRLGPFDRVFLHGDIVANHVFANEGRFTGIIDWGDALVTDRHFEIIQIHRDLFDCDKTLLRIFLESANWPMTSAFAKRAMSFALYRQAIGLVQHDGRMDVFEPIAQRFPLAEIATLDELAEVLFEV